MAKQFLAVLVLVSMLVVASPSLAQKGAVYMDPWEHGYPGSGGFDKSWNNQNTFMRPYQPNAYGPGINSDATGQPFRWQPQWGGPLPPGSRVQPDAYGLGVGMDEYGRPVKPARGW